MQDEGLRQLTASEPLSLEEEYEMQGMLRTIHTLTFIGLNPVSMVIPSPIRRKMAAG